MGFFHQFYFHFQVFDSFIYFLARFVVVLLWFCLGFFVIAVVSLAGFIYFLLKDSVISINIILSSFSLALAMLEYSVPSVIRLLNSSRDIFSWLSFVVFLH